MTTFVALAPQEVARRERALAKSHEAQRKARAVAKTLDPKSRERLTPYQASQLATRIERSGRFWASAFPLTFGQSMVEVRSKERPFPVVETLRTPADAVVWLSGHA